ncbi:MAG: TonB-dependent receptor plug domain-containing protein [Desulfatiglandales bacterium]
MKKRKQILGLIVVLWFVFITAGVVAAEPASGQQVFELGEVVVAGERQSVNLATTVTEVSAENISAKGAANVAEALELLPGIDIQRVGKSEAQVSIRGFSQNQVKVLIDGVPAHESYFGTVDLSMIPTDAISKITVTKGASSVLYGSNTMGGVINIITKKGGPEPYTSLTASFGNNSTAHYSLNHGASVGAFNYWVTGGYQKSDGYRLSDDFDPNDPRFGVGSPFNEDGGTRDLSYYDRKNLNVKVGYDPDPDTSLYLSFNYIDSSRGIPTFSYRYWEYDTYEQWQLSLVGEHRFNDVFKAKARAYYVDHDNSLKDVSWDADHTTKGRKWFERSYYDDFTVGGEVQTFFDFGKWSYLKLGAGYMEDNHKEADFLSDDCFFVLMGWNPVGWQPEREYTAETFTFAIEDEIKPFDRFSIVAGISYDTFEPTKTHDQPAPGKSETINPQIGLVFDITDRTRLHASVGKKTRFPKLIELYSTLIGGNPDLDPEKTTAYELGASHTFSDAATGSVAFFYNDVRDLIAYIDDVYININEARIYGVEANLSWKVTENLKTDLNYTFMETEDKSHNDRELEGRPRHRINLDLGYRFPFGLMANLQASYTHRQYWENDAQNWEKLPDYFLLNGKLTQDLGRFWRFDSEVFLQVSNITDTDYYEVNGPEPGRNFLAGMTLRF